MIRKMLTLSLALASATAQAEELRGVWGGGLSGTSLSGAPVELSWTLEAIGDLGRLTAEGRGWGADSSGPRAVCTYFIDYGSGGTMTPEPGTAPICPDVASVTLVPAGAEMQVLAAPGLEIFGDVTLRPLATYIPEDDLGVIPPNLDVLGVSPRQTLAEIEKNLLDERGWKIASSYAASGSGSNAGVLGRVYVRDDQTVARYEPPLPVDFIVIGYEAVSDLANAEAPDVRAVLIKRRTSYFDAGQQVAVATMSDAIIAKYGPRSDGDQDASEQRNYNPDGSVVADQRTPFAPCILRRTGILEPRGDRVQFRWVYEPPGGGRNLEIWGQSYPGCGAHADVRLRPEKDTGAVSELETFLSDRELVLNAEWTFIEAKLEGKMRTAAELATNGGDDVPEL